MNDILFKAISLEDKETIEYYLQKDKSIYLGAFTFSSLVSWEMLYHYQWAIVEDTLLFKFKTVEDGQEHLLKPFGRFPKLLQDLIINYAGSLNYKLTIFGASDEFINEYPRFVSHFLKTPVREFDNYIYLSQDLALLKGRDFQSKRNLINQFEANNQWLAEPLSVMNIPECRAILNRIYTQEEIKKDFYLEYELNALDFVLNHFDQIKEEGILIRAAGEPVAFSIFEKLNTDTFVIHFEKAIKEYKGLYQLVNRETARIINSKGFRFINREEDLGIEGLRKSKLSYHPVELIHSHALVFNR